MIIKQGELPGAPPCPSCGRILDGYTSIHGEREMRPGDFSVCGYCATPLMWDGFAYSRLLGSALVLARLRPEFLQAEAVARAARDGLL